MMLNRRGLMTAAGLSAAFLLAMAGISRPLEHHHPPQHAQLHEHFYKTWMRPDMPNVSCCDKKDCYPTAARFQSGRWFAQRREDGQWLSVPPQKIEVNRDSPDGQNHLCAPPPATASYYENGVICFIPGAGG